MSHVVDVDKQDESPLSIWLDRLAWSVVPLSILIIDFEVRREFQHSVFFFPFWLLGSVAASLVAWLSFTTLMRGLRARLALVPFVSLLFGLMVFITWGSVLERHFSITPNEMLYLLEEPKNGVSLVTDAWTWKSGLAFFALTTTWIVVLLRSSRKAVSHKFRVAAAFGLVCCSIFVIMLPSIFVMPWTPYPSDIRSAFVVWEGVSDYVSGQRSMNVGDASRAIVTPQEKREGPSILLIVGESMRVTHMNALSDYPRATTPNLGALIDARPDETFIFNKHVPSSAATYWATAGIFLGQYPELSRTEIRESPAIWQYAAARSYDTFVVSSQSWSWAKLKDLWLDPGPNHFADADTLGLPITNDTGTDDVVVANWLAEQLQSGAIKRPFMGVFQTNSTHWPFIESPNSKWDRDEVGKFDAATLRTDEGIGALIDALKKSGELDDTVIILTSDHAESLDPDLNDDDRERINRIDPALFHGARVGSCEPIYINAPLFLFLPKKWQDNLEIDALTLRANGERVTSHTDIFASILEILDMKPQTKQNGRSLFEPISKERIAFCFTTPQWAMREISGVGARQEDRFLYTRANLSQPYYFDLSNRAPFRRRYLPSEKPDWADGFLKSVKEDSPVPAYLNHALEGLR